VISWQYRIPINGDIFGFLWVILTFWWINQIIQPFASKINFAKVLMNIKKLFYIKIN